MHSRTAPAFDDASPAVADLPLEACDDFDEAQHAPRYCPTDLLAAFTLMMAGHGRCINTPMMLGDREYAMWQLACARTLGDEDLKDAATRLFSYFDDTAKVA
ncbi:hypothetical protein [Ramlibacter sp.]|uniref:hypothetical protein n=1 Tax=Ramlibacter sp. TaxID=1917967 RepID=UPI0017984980|nr:hypothetical protein [Ramlibacter sp.]MBA2674807.1 hypothetical protein [Ramlibacter sp.]